MSSKANIRRRRDWGLRWSWRYSSPCDWSDYARWRSSSIVAARCSVFLVPRFRWDELDRGSLRRAEDLRREESLLVFEWNSNETGWWSPPFVRRSNLCARTIYQRNDCRASSSISFSSRLSSAEFRRSTAIKRDFLNKTLNRRALKQCQRRENLARLDGNISFSLFAPRCQEETIDSRRSSRWKSIFFLLFDKQREWETRESRARRSTSSSLTFKFNRCFHWNDSLRRPKGTTIVQSANEQLSNQPKDFVLLKSSKQKSNDFHLPISFSTIKLLSERKHSTTKNRPTKIELKRSTIVFEVTSVLLSAVK